MSSISIDLRNDPEKPRGREMIEQLVGAHMSAQNEAELLLLVRHSMDELMSASSMANTVRVMTHATYRGQALIVRLLNLATRQRIALEAAGVDVDPGVRQRWPEQFRDERLEIWAEVRDDLNDRQS
jgi:hypothetical protein